MSMQSQVQKALQAIISRIHQLFANNFTSLTQSRDLNPHQNQLLLELDRNSSKYHQLAGALAIQSYTSHLIELIKRCEPLLEITAILFQNLAQIKDLSQRYRDEQLYGNIEQSWSNLSKIAQITHELFPNSSLVNVHRQFMEGGYVSVSQTIYTRMFDQNIQLKAKVEQNDRQLLELELKFTKLLQQHDGCDGNIDSQARLIQVRQKLAARQDEIQQMNQQFAFQIQKYNTVYEVMKRQIEQLKDYRQVDVYDMVERLQTEIVKLRQEKERDELIIHELKQRLSNGGSSSRVRPNTYSRAYY